MAVWLLACLILGPWMVPGTFGMERYCPDSPLKVTTRFLPNGADSMGEGHKNRQSEIEWTIVPGVDGDQATLVYFQDNDKEFCSVRFPVPGSGADIVVLDRKDEVFDRSPGHLIPLPGFPAPCRFVDLSGVRDGGFDIVKSAGGRKFRKHYRVSMKNIPMEDARENGWVREPSVALWDDAHEFLLIIVTDDNDGFLFQQLWNKDDQWWIYEETQNSKSWRH